MDKKRRVRISNVCGKRDYTSISQWKRNSYLGNGFDRLSIPNGVLWTETAFIRGHMEHKFRYQNNKFELIGYTYVNSDGLVGKMYLVDYNLSTGRRIEILDCYDSEEPEGRVEKIIKLNPLPDIFNFEQY